MHNRIGRCGSWLVAGVLMALPWAAQGQSLFGGAAGPAFTDAQVQRGQSVYGANCLMCHGERLDDGQFGPPLAAYTAVLLGNTANPTWNETHRDLPFVFVSSASLASSGLAMVTTPTRETGPARVLGCLGVAVAAFLAHFL